MILVQPSLYPSLDLATVINSEALSILGGSILPTNAHSMRHDVIASESREENLHSCPSLVRFFDAPGKFYTGVLEILRRNLAELWSYIGCFRCLRSLDVLAAGSIRETFYPFPLCLVDDVCLFWCGVPCIISPMSPLFRSRIAQRIS